MESTVTYESKPKMKRTIFIEGLPGVGNIGKTAADFMVKSLNAERFATILSEHFPPQVMLDDDCVIRLASNELWHARVNGRDIIFLLGDCQAMTPNGQFLFCKDLFDNELEKFGVTEIYTLGGYGTGGMVENPRILGAISDIKMKERLEECGVVFSPGEPGPGIVGASGLFIGFGKIAGIPSACLMGETSGFFVDYKSAVELIKVLEKLIGFDIDKTELLQGAEHIDELNARVKEYGAEQEKHSLTYIG
ncbi:MAG: proteasome assembly chaperone family protein [Candidatus Methanomethylophilaceae archaeon]